MLFLFLNSCTNTVEEVIVPSDFSGPVVIFYQQDKIKGESIKKGNNLKIFVPADGVIFTQFVNKEGGLDAHFDGDSNKIIIGHHVGSIYLDREIPYSVFYVGDTIDLEKMKKLEYDDLKLIYEKNK